MAYLLAAAGPAWAGSRPLSGAAVNLQPTHTRDVSTPATRLPQAVRQNRLALLRDLAALPAGILDLAELPGF